MADFYLRSTSTVGERAASTAYTLGQRVVIARADTQASFAIMRRYIYEATTAGTTGTAVPAYNTAVGGTVTDGTVVWTTRECSNWVDANRHMDYLASRLAAGDTMYMSHVHAETLTATGSAVFAGTLVNPNKVLCVNDAAFPPTTLAKTGKIITTLAAGYAVQNPVYVYGVVMEIGSGNNGLTFSINNGTATSTQVWEDCNLRIVSTSGSSGLNINGATNLLFKTILRNTTLHTGNEATIINVPGTLEWDGGVSLCQSTAAPKVFGFPPKGGQGRHSGIDFSGMVAGTSLVNPSAGFGKHVFRNCRLPTGWTGSLILGVIAGPGIRAEMYNCDSADTNYRLWTEDYSGSVRSETAIVRTGGASDGTTPLAWKMTTAANVVYPTLSLDSPEIVRWNEVVGTALTATIEVITDNVTLTDAECWLEVQYLSTAGFPLASFITDAKAGFLAAAAAQTASTVAWTTTGLTTPVKQKLSVTFTPQEKGFLHARIMLARPNTTVYVDPLLTVA